jgi:hypothetical protein
METGHLRALRGTVKVVRDAYSSRGLSSSPPSLGLWDKTPTTWHQVKVSLRAERSNLCPNTEIASSLTAPRNDNLGSSAPLFVQSFVSRSLFMVVTEVGSVRISLLPLLPCPYSRPNACVKQYSSFQ